MTEQVWVSAQRGLAQQWSTFDTLPEALAWLARMEADGWKVGEPCVVEVDFTEDAA